MLEKVGDPFGIFLVRLLALDCPNILRVGQNDMDMVFKDIEDRDPILACRLHADMTAIVLKKPIAECEEAGVQGGKRLLRIRCDVVLVRGSDGTGNRPLVHINATTDGVDDFQRITSFSKR